MDKKGPSPLHDVSGNSQMTKPSGTKGDILAIAEQLFAERGIGAVSLRKISEKSGNKNKSAAQYHFGSKEDIISGIIRFRRADLDQFRKNHPAARGIYENNSVESLVRFLVITLKDFQDTPGRHYFVIFLQEIIQYGMFSKLEEDISDLAPLTAFISQRIRRLLPETTEDLWNLRLRLSFGIIVDSLAEYQLGSIGHTLPQQTFIDEVVRISCSAFGLLDERGIGPGSKWGRS